MMPRARRARCALRPAGPVRQRLRRPQHLHLQAEARGALARRHAADGRRRRLLVHDLQGQGPSRPRARADPYDGGGGRRCRDVPPDLQRQAVGAHHPRRSSNSRSSRRPSTRPTRSTARRSIRRSARARTRSAASARARPSNMSASPTIGAATCRSTAARTISTASASNSTATGRPHSRRSRRATSSSGRNSPRAPGRPAMIFRRSPPARWSSANFPGEKRPSMQATAVNQRRERFRDPRVRRAIAMCFDFEWTQRNLFYGSYERSNSCFERSDYKADGPAVRRGTGAARAVARQSCRRKRSARP